MTIRVFALERELRGRARSYRITVFSVLAVALVLAFLPQASGQPGGGINPLAPPDRSSPRATLDSFLRSSTEGWRIVSKGLPGREVPRTVAMRCIDVSALPIALQEDIALETTLKLFDVLNRIPLPPLDEVPDAEAVEEDGQNYWRIPDTGIFIVRQTEGPRAGEWLFSSDLIEQIDEFYELTRSLPLNKGAVVADGYRLYTATGGPLVPDAWILQLPGWAMAIFFEQAVWQWLAGFLLVGLAGALVVRAVSQAPRGPDLIETSVRSMLSAPLLVMAIAVITEYLIDLQLNFTGEVLVTLRVVFFSAFYLAFAWALMRAGSLVAARVSASAAAQAGRIDADLVRILAFLSSLILAVFVLALGVQTMGVPLLGVLTGLGVGGIAIALAAQTTLENFIGALTLFSDQPLRVGNTCRFGNTFGTIERIGLRSTRVRTAERTVVSVPNSQLAKLEIENLAHRDKLMLKTKLAFALDTTETQLERLLARLRTALGEAPSVDGETARVRLIALGPQAIEIEVFAYVKTQEWAEFLRVREALYLRFLRETGDLGIRLAPPAQLQYNGLLDDETA